MNWINVSNNPRHEVYDLVDDKGTHLLTLSINIKAGTARIDYKNEKRVFLIGKEGFFNSKTILRNEYGIKVAQMGYENWHDKEGVIEFDDKKFHYQIHNNPLAELIIYTEDSNKPLITCGLSAFDNNPSVYFRKKYATTDTSLLMALCWYMFLPIAKENSLSFAS